MYFEKFIIINQKSAALDDSFLLSKKTFRQVVKEIALDIKWEIGGSHPREEYRWESDIIIVM